MRAEIAARVCRGTATAPPGSTFVTVVALVVFALALAGCAARPPVVSSAPWSDAFQACGMPADALAAPWPALEADFCVQARVLGAQLECLARVLPASASAQSQFSGAGLAEFQSCLQPLASGLIAGRTGRADDMDRALRHCVLQLDLAPAGPRVLRPWWQLLRHTGPAPTSDEGPAEVMANPGMPTAAPAGAPSAAGPLASSTGLQLRASTSLSWPACADTAALKRAPVSGNPPARPQGRAAGTPNRAPNDHQRTP